MNFIQKCETLKPNCVILYIPLQNFSCANLHPCGSLFDLYSNVPSVIENLKSLKVMLESEGIEVISVLDIFKKNRKFLLDRAIEAVTYILESENHDNSIVANEKIEFFMSEEYKKQTLSHYSDEDLIEILLNRPVCHLASESINTHLVLKSVLFQPLGNMVFTRDHQIITPKGIILCNLAEQRKREIQLIRWFYEMLDIPVLAEINGDLKLEGGDFMIVKEDLSLMGVGLRSNMAAAEFLMENDFLLTKRFGVVVDEKDFDQTRMHLDTFFNILSSEEVVLLEMNDVKPGKYIDGKEVDLRRSIHIYEKSNEKKKHGNYELGKVMDFELFLREEGFRIYKTTHEEQLGFMTNFLNIGNGRIITPNKDMGKFLEKNGSKVEAKFLEFGEVMKMYGAVHCTTQAIRF